MTTTFEANMSASVARTDEQDLNRLLDPAQFYRDPNDVVADKRLNLAEKRAILSSWASDACAVESMPALRRPPGLAAPVSFDAIMEALQELDRQLAPGTSAAMARSANHLEPIWY